MSEKEALAYAMFCAYLKYEGNADDCMPRWDEVVEYVQKGYLQEVDAAMAWLFEKGYLSQAGLKFVGRWEANKEAEQNQVLFAALQARFPQYGFVLVGGGYIAMRLANLSAEESEPARIEIAAFIKEWKKEQGSE